MRGSLSTTHHDPGGIKKGLKRTGWFPDENHAPPHAADVDPEKIQTITTGNFSAKLYPTGVRTISSEGSHEEAV